MVHNRNLDKRGGSERIYGTIRVTSTTYTFTSMIVMIVYNYTRRSGFTVCIKVDVWSSRGRVESFRALIFDATRDAYSYAALNTRIVILYM